MKIKEQPDIEFGTVGSMKNLLDSLIKNFYRDNERWEGLKMPLAVVKDRTAKLFQIEELMKYKNWFDSKEKD
jgi:hypothetical protein